MRLKVHFFRMLMLANVVNSLKILGIFPHPGLSHFHFFHPIMRGLANAGHDVTVVSHFPDKNAPKNYLDMPLTATELLTNSVNLEVGDNLYLNNPTDFIFKFNWKFGKLIAF